MIPSEMRARSKRRSQRMLRELRQLAHLNDVDPSQVMRMYQESHTDHPVRPGKLTRKGRV